MHIREETDSFVAAAAREQLLRDEATFERDGDSDVSNLLEQMGRPLSAATVISLLLELNPSLIFEQSINYPELTGIYVSGPRQTVSGIVVERRHICGMPTPPAILPEFSVRHYKMEEVPNPKDKYELIETRKFADETRGWRTVLLRLIKERVISPGAAERLFDIPSGRSSRYWQQQT